MSAPSLVVVAVTLVLALLVMRRPDDIHSPARPERTSQVRALILAIAWAGLPVAEGAEPGRPAQWAAPVEGQAGLSNTFRVSDELLRGAQPEDAGFGSLKAMGVRTVVNLRTFHSDRAQCERNGLRYVHVPSQAWSLDDEEVVTFLRIVTDPDSQPVFVHCQHGSDRTGVMSAAYRMVVQGWSTDDAIAEMVDGGYGFHAVWGNLIRHVRRLDVERIRATVGVELPAGESRGVGRPVVEDCDELSPPPDRPPPLREPGPEAAEPPAGSRR